MASINTFQDILNALEQDPALREQLRRHILTDKLIQFSTAVLEIRTDVAGLRTSGENLEEGQGRLETRAT